MKTFTFDKAFVIASCLLLVSCVHEIHTLVEDEQGEVYIVRELYEKEHLRHPYSFRQEEMLRYLEQVDYTYDNLFSWSSPRQIFSAEERAFLAKYLVMAFEEARARDEIRFETTAEGFTNRGSCVIRNGSLELTMSTFASDSFYEDHSYLESFKSKWRLSPGDIGEHLKRPQWVGSDIILYNTLKTPLAKIALAQPKNTAEEPEKTVPKDKTSGIDLEQKWLNEEIERAKREEEKEID